MIPFSFCKEEYSLFIKNQKQTVSTIEHHYTVVLVWLLESKARVTSSSPCKELETLHILPTPVAFPLVSSRAEKSVAWMDQTVTPTIIYSLFIVDPGFTDSHSKPRSHSLLAMCYHALPCTSTPDCAATLPVGSCYREQILKKTKATNNFLPFWGMIQFLLQLSNL